MAKACGLYIIIGECSERHWKGEELSTEEVNLISQKQLSKADR